MKKFSYTEMFVTQLKKSTLKKM